MEDHPVQAMSMSLESQAEVGLDLEDPSACRSFLLLRGFKEIDVANHGAAARAEALTNKRQVISFSPDDFGKRGQVRQRERLDESLVAPFSVAANALIEAAEILRARTTQVMQDIQQKSDLSCAHAERVAGVILDYGERARMLIASTHGSVADAHNEVNGIIDITHASIEAVVTKLTAAHGAAIDAAMGVQAQEEQPPLIASA